MTVESVFKELKARKFASVYFFCGEEPYYIDQLAQHIEQQVLTDDEREFNQTVLYGLETTPDEVASVAKRFPMMSEYQVVLVKEAQLMKKIEDLEAYVKNPQASTILVFCYKGKEPDKRKSFAKTLMDKAVYLKSDRLKDEKIPEWVSNYLHKKGYRIEAQAAVMVAEYVGNELEKVANEADKLMVNFPPGYEFSTKDVERLVGISREYNVFELQKALATRNVLKANQIAFYMAGNQKAHPLPMILASLYGYFSKILLFQWLKSKGEREMAKAMGIPPFYIREYEMAARQFQPAKLIRIMHHIRDYDLRGKGVNNEGTEHGELLKELVFKIVH